MYVNYNPHENFTDEMFAPLKVKVLRVGYVFDRLTEPEQKMLHYEVVMNNKERLMRLRDKAIADGATDRTAELVVSALSPNDSIDRVILVTR